MVGEAETLESILKSMHSVAGQQASHELVDIAKQNVVNVDEHILDVDAGHCVLQSLVVAY